MRKNIRILGEFVGHLLMGAILFVLLMGFGAGLSRLVHWMEPWIGDHEFVESIKLAEKAILYADIVFVVWWAIYSTYRAIRDGMKDGRHE